jgi:hypothetical protein
MVACSPDVERQAAAAPAAGTPYFWPESYTMMTVPVAMTPLRSPTRLTTSQFQTLAEIPAALEWFANLTNLNTRRTYWQDIQGFQAFAGPHRPEQFRDVTRAHVMA